MSVTVTTQFELDAALAAKESTIYIKSPAGVWLTLSRTGSARVEAWGSAHVVARDSAHVVARGSARVEAWGSAHVVARDSAHVVARGSAHVVARGSARVVARDSAHVEARGSARVEAWGSAHVEAWGSAYVVAWGSARVVAGRFVAVHLYSQRVTLDGGVVIDMTAIERNDAGTFCDLYGVKVNDGVATLYKAVDDNLQAGHAYRPTTYAIGETTTCPDWRDDNECGGGLHLSPSPSMATQYNRQATRWLRVEAKVSDLRPIGDKCKVPECRVIAEVDRRGRPIGGAA